MLLPSISSMAALSVLESTWIWNDLLWSLFLRQSDRLKPVTFSPANMQGEFITDYNMLATGSLIAAGFSVLIFLFFRRFFIHGLTVKAEKG